MGATVTSVPPNASRLLTAAVEAKVASPRTIINFCDLGGNHTDPNPAKPGGKAKANMSATAAVAAAV